MATNLGKKWFFVFGFEKNELENISEKELVTLKMLAKDLLGMTAGQIQSAVEEGILVEVENEA
ncbi:MAG: type II toxin-antitoxin system RelE/ParE family toxin [Syntrophales bacterium]|nr:type II toxin-antitoxin system RelE/ParE family toxin [Syntrophales bacterium]MCK9528847.1 type II toxin-antitoxin system RelE/ParE family toxin [Syntrophales bacterium]